MKKVHRLWCQEGLQRRVHSPRKRAGTSSVPEVVADAPKVVWALDFQFDSTIDGKAIKIASMVDEHTRESLLHLVERSITAERLVVELEKVFTAAGGPPKVLRMDNGPELVSQALQRFCENKVGLSYIPPGTPWNNGYIESFNNRLTQGVSQPQPLEHPVRGPRGHRRLQTRAQSPTPPFSPGLPNSRRVRCPMQAHPLPRGLRNQLNPNNNNQALEPGGLSIGVHAPLSTDICRHIAQLSKIRNAAGHQCVSWRLSARARVFARELRIKRAVGLVGCQGALTTKSSDREQSQQRRSSPGRI